ncbi:GTP 3',8-cyclase MoaA [Candidatus Bathyarchaeota archaeon]|nr:GTP 3',8-cyclase MoaA [Candidatus Bathyarchaeota archaeon]
MIPLQDTYGRTITSLRISLTQKCNFNCFFCHQEGEHNPNKEMTSTEIDTIVSVAAELGINKIKFTGGEPLLRDDIEEIIRKAASHVEEVSMTTNAYFLSEKACILKKAGLKRVNISFHSSKPEVFKSITGFDVINKVKEGIRTAKLCELNPIKINMVIMKGINDSEIYDVLKFSHEVGAIFQVIEYQPLERGLEEWNNYYYDLTPLEELWSKEAINIVEREMHHRKQYTLKNGSIVEVVRPMHNTVFCANCNRLRLTSDGYLKPCLMRNDNLVPLVQLIRNGDSRDKLLEAFREATLKRIPYWRS